MGETALNAVLCGGDRPQRGFMWGNPHPTRFYVGEPAPNAVLCGGTRTQRGFMWGNPHPTRFYVGEPASNAVLEEAIERLLRGY